MAKRSRKRMRGSPIPLVVVERVAADVVPGHGVNLALGLQLTEACRIWKRRDGRYTGRFVYRGKGRSDGVDESVVHTVSGFQLA